MQVFNVVRFKVRSGEEAAFLEAHRNGKAKWPGLERGVIIVEGLDLSGPPLGPYELRVLPLRLAGLDGAPARAVLLG